MRPKGVGEAGEGWPKREVLPKDPFLSIVIIKVCVVQLSSYVNYDVSKFP